MTWLAVPLATYTSWLATGAPSGLTVTPIGAPMVGGGHLEGRCHALAVGPVELHDAAVAVVGDVDVPAESTPISRAAQTAEPSGISTARRRAASEPIRHISDPVACTRQPGHYRCRDDDIAVRGDLHTGRVHGRPSRSADGLGVCGGHRGSPERAAITGVLATNADTTGRAQHDTRMRPGICPGKLYLPAFIFIEPVSRLPHLLTNG